MNANECFLVNVWISLTFSLEHNAHERKEEERVL